MDDAPWGIGAWQFLCLYWIGFAVAVGGVVLSVAMARRTAAGVAPDPRPLGHYELAWIAGGAARVEEVVVAALLAADRVRVDGRGVLWRSSAGQGVDPVERWVLGMLPTGRQLSGAGSLGFASTPLCRELVEDLVRRGHLVPGGRRSPGYQAHRVLGVVLGVGVVRLVAELDQGWQVGVLLISLVLTAALWSAVAYVLRAGADRPSERGLAAVARVAAQVQRIPDLRSVPAWLPAAVAVEGIAVYPDLAVADLVAAHTRPGR